MTQHNRVLLIQEDTRQTELFADLIREVAECQVDVVTSVESSLDWIARVSYHLVVIDSSTMLQTGDHPRGASGVIPPETGSGFTATPAQDIDSLSLLESIKRIRPETSVILLSDRPSVEHAVSAIKLGAEDYLKKPFNLEAFRLAVKRGLDRKTVFGESGSANGYLNLLNSCQMISASLEQNKILGIIQSFFARELHSDHSAIYCLQENVPVRVEDATSIDSRRDRALEEILDISIHAANPFLRMVESREVYRFVERGQLTPGLFIFKFRCVGAADYFCVCLSPEIPLAIESFESRLRMLRAQIEVTGKNIEQYLGVQYLVYVDDATGLYNTRYLYTILDREIAQAQSSKQSFAILFLDGDRFKSINDNYGHLAGTKLLHELGEQLKRYVRGKDTVFRYGGDEFVAVLSPCDLPTAETVAERIRSSVERHTFLTSEGLNIRITVSIGVALFPDHADSKRAVIDAADHAMYTAKKTTRNSVFIAPHPKASGSPGPDVASDKASTEKILEIEKVPEKFSEKLQGNMSPEASVTPLKAVATGKRNSKGN